MKEAKSRLNMILAMGIFGTAGLIRRLIPLSSGAIAAVRGVIGMLFLLVVMALRREGFAKIKGKWLLLLFSGACIGFNWMLLFEGCVYSVTVATVCYYVAPLLVAVLSPLFLKEKTTKRKLLCVLCALLGVSMVSGLFSFGGMTGSNGAAALYGLSAALLYALVMLLNKRMSDLPAYPKTACQLGAAGMVILPYVLVSEIKSFALLSFDAVLLLLLLGVLHTGLAYVLYFSAFSGLSAQSVALMSYLDPIVAVVLSALILNERMGPIEIVGIVLTLLSALVAEWPQHKKT